MPLIPLGKVEGDDENCVTEIPVAKDSFPFFGTNALQITFTRLCKAVRFHQQSRCSQAELHIERTHMDPKRAAASFETFDIKFLQPAAPFSLQKGTLPAKFKHYKCTVLEMFYSTGEVIHFHRLSK